MDSASIGCSRSIGATTERDHDSPIYPNLAKDVVPDGPNQLWAKPAWKVPPALAGRPAQGADLTYVALAASFVYLAAILDAWSRKVVGYAISRSIEAHMAVAALKAAMRARRPGRLHPPLRH